MSARLTPFIRCVCGKAHVVSHISPTTVCACGLRLYEQAYRLPNQGTTNQKGHTA